MYMYADCYWQFHMRITGDGYTKWAFASLPPPTEQGMGSEMIVDWTPEKEQKLIELVESGMNWEAIADLYYSTGPNMRFKYQTLVKNGKVENPVRNYGKYI